MANNPIVAEPSNGPLLEVEFIDRTLPNYHKYYENATTQYDPETRRYVVRNGTLSTIPPAPSSHVLTDKKAEPPKDMPTIVSYWNMIFPSAMEKHKGNHAAPRNSNSANDIRNASTWAEVYDKLETARDAYLELSGTTGHLRRIWRWTADNGAEPARLATKIVPQMDIVTPVLGAVQIVLEAVKKGAEVRKETLNAFDELDAVFADVEIFLATFQREDTVIEQAVVLVASVLHAVEWGIAFFTRPGLIRGLKSIAKGKDYEAPLLESLADITRRSKSLMAWAVKTHIRDFADYSSATKRIHHLILNNQEHIAVRVDLVHTRIDVVSAQNEFIITQNENNRNAQDGMNATLALLMDKHEETKRELRFLRDQNREQQKLLTAGKREISRLGELIVRSVSPLQGLVGTITRPQLPETPLNQHQRGIYQEDLWAMLNMYDIDIEDMDDIEKQQGHLDAQERARAEQIVHTQIFQDWIVSPESSKLMIHGNFSSGCMMETSSLSVFCTALARAFRSRQRYLALVWFCGRHMGSNDSDESSDGLDDLDDDSSDEYHHCHFFHRDGPGIKAGTLRKMVRSLIAQLLSDHDFGYSNPMNPDTDLPLIEEGDLSELALLLRWLVLQLPEDITLVFLIDGIVFYERDEFEEPMLDVLGDILGLTVASDVSATVKVLVTSPWPTSTVRAAFEEGSWVDTGNWQGGGKESILSMGVLQPRQGGASKERIDRELQELGSKI
ncbi:hypothetical protein QBC34DRAFT_100872 [Podospora aff. communis PSN243]|uniref:Fungal STAND N-terminal Goodbye domain-containing protein n=1 Tax=Podospora aff. communis PSN243 TaxID=3040156 RepID=A0AAV9GLT6_9PEZI|nr:hypothetical protein QBC34DRAFT_100872 [Podospora aff. communis PSN243]